MVSPAIRFRDSLGDVDRLMDIHTHLTGTGPGRRHDVDVLHKSAILFACASFEAFVETLASEAFGKIVEGTTEASELPKPILQAVAKLVKEDKNDLKVWDLAGDGWKVICTSLKNGVVKKHVGPFNTPKPGNIDALLKDLIGMPSLSTHWHWKGMGSASASAKVKEFVELRGALAHGERPAPNVTKGMVDGYVKFLGILSVRSANEVRKYCHGLTGTHPWNRVKHGSIV